MSVQQPGHVHGPNAADPADARRVAGLAFDAAERIRNRPVIVAIDGPSGAGKSSLAELVMPLLGAAPVVHLDDLYPGWDGLLAGNESLVRVLRVLRSGRPASYRRFDWRTGDFAESHTAEVRRFVVVEGCGASAGDARALTDVRIWVDAPEALRRARGGARTGGYGGEWERWARQERDLFATDYTRDHAHLLIQTG